MAAEIGNQSGIKVRQALKNLAAEGELNLAPLALQISAHFRPDLDIVPYKAHLDAITHAAEAIETAELELQRKALAKILHKDFGYHGDQENYDDLANADLCAVIDRRKGLPVALGILWIHAARAAGLVAEGLHFPDHFLIRIGDDLGERLIIDPFHAGITQNSHDLRDLIKHARGAGAELTAETHAAASDRDVLLRLLNNSKQRLIRDGKLSQALRVIDLMRAMAPDQVILHYEAGMTQYRLGHHGAAIAALELFTQTTEDQRLKQEAQGLIQRLKAEFDKG